MPNLWINDVPDALVDALRARAVRNQRTLEAELLALLTEAVRAPASPPLDGPSNFEGRRGTRTIEDFARDSRIRYPQPIRIGPAAVDIIRAERDSR